MNEQRAKRDRGKGSIIVRGRAVWLQYSDRPGHKIREAARIDGRTLKTETKNWQQKADKLLQRKLGEAAAGIVKDNPSLRYEDLRDAFMTDYKVNRRKSLRWKKDEETSELKPYLDKVQRLDDFFAGRRAIEIDADLIRKFIADQQGRGLSNGSINRSISALRRMFNLAAEDEKLRNVPHFHMVEEAAPRQGFFEPDEYEALSRALPNYLRLPLAMGYYTAARSGEILSLKWDQIDFLSGVIRLRPGETKSGKGRSIPIVPQLRSLLIEQRSRRQNDCPYVCFRLDRGGRAVKIKGFRKAWYSACMKCGLGKMEPVIDEATGQPVYVKPRGLCSKPKVKTVYAGRLFHDLRRSGVRNLVRAGVSEKIAMSISGHLTRSVFDRYNIVSERDISEAAQKLAAFHGNGHISDTDSTEVQQVNIPTI